MISIVGEKIGATSVIYRKRGPALVKGLRFENGLDLFLDALHYGDFHCGIALIDNGESVYYINRDNTIAVPPVYKMGDDFSEERAFVTDMENTFLIDTSGGVIKEFEGLFVAYRFNEGLARIAELSGDHEYLTSGYVNSEGEFVIPMTLENRIENIYELTDESGCLSDGLIRIKKNGLYGFIDAEQNLIIPCEYESASKFENGIAVVKKNGKAGFINKQNEQLFKSGLTSTLNFREGLAPAAVSDRWGLLNIDGEFVIEPDYERLDRPKGGEVIFAENGKLGIMDLSGNTIIPAEYDNLNYAVEGIYKFAIGSRPGVMDKPGNSIISDMEVFNRYQLYEN